LLYSLRVIDKNSIEKEIQKPYEIIVELEEEEWNAISIFAAFHELSTSEYVRIVIQSEIEALSHSEEETRRFFEEIGEDPDEE